MFGDLDIDVPDDILQHFINAGNDIELSQQSSQEPRLEILIQPKQRGYRFRYSSEGNTHGGIPGEDSSKGKKSSPTIQIQNYSGKAAICITLVCADDPSKLHAHNLVGKNVQNGMYHSEHDKKEWVLKIPNLGIEHVTKKDLVNVLHDKLLQAYRLNLFTEKHHSTESFDIATLIDSFGQPDNNTTVDEAFANIIEVEENKKLRKEAEQLAKEIDLSAVRLLITAFLPDEDGRLTKALPSIVSDPIYDAKAAHAGQLRICRMSKTSSSVVGNEEVFLLCDKVQKDDIAVRFFQEDKTGKVSWEDFGRFSSADVHKQSAIVFKTPPYVDRGIQKPVTVQIQLKRKKDGEGSEPKPFIYKPEEFDKYKIGEKRRKELPADIDKFLKGSAVKQFRPSTSTSATSTQSAEMFLNTTGIKFFKP